MKYLLSVLSLTVWLGFQVRADDYKASMFGIKSNGTTLNTNSIQKAIDFIHEKGGGRLVFYVGRYLTGTIQLKSNVTIHLEEGATLVGSTNIYDYNLSVRFPALITAYSADHIAITGKGVIDGQGRELANNVTDQVQKGILKDALVNDRSALWRPKGIYLRECKQVELSGIVVKNAAEWVVVCDQVQQLKIDKITVDSKAFWNNDGIDIVDCKDVIISNSYIDSSDDAICFKSHDATKMCENVEVRNCVAPVKCQWH